MNTRECAWIHMNTHIDTPHPTPHPHNSLHNHNTGGVIGYLCVRPAGSSQNRSPCYVRHADTPCITYHLATVCVCVCDSLHVYTDIPKHPTSTIIHQNIHAQTINAPPPSHSELHEARRHTLDQQQHTMFMIAQRDTAIAAARQHHADERKHVQDLHVQVRTVEHTLAGGARGAQRGRLQGEALQGRVGRARAALAALRQQTADARGCVVCGRGGCGVWCMCTALVCVLLWFNYHTYSCTQ